MDESVWDFRENSGRWLFLASSDPYVQFNLGTYHLSPACIDIIFTYNMKMFVVYCKRCQLLDLSEYI